MIIMYLSAKKERLLILKNAITKIKTTISTRHYNREMGCCCDFAFHFLWLYKELTQMGLLYQWIWSSIEYAALAQPYEQIINLLWLIHNGWNLYDPYHIHMWVRSCSALRPRALDFFNLSDLFAKTNKFQLSYFFFLRTSQAVANQFHKEDIIKQAT